MYHPVSSDSIPHESLSNENGGNHDRVPADEVHLLSKDEHDDDHEDDHEDEEVARPTFWNNPVLPYLCAGLSVGLLFIALKIFVVKYGHSTTHGHHRGSEKLYNNGTAYFGPTVVLLSLDGFRQEYLDRNVTPHLSALVSQGVRADHMHPCFPSNTFPNHWTLATGLYPETHGIVANTFYDPIENVTFRHSDDANASQRQWWKGEPIWVTGAKQGLVSASIMWPGATAIRPDYLVPYNNSMSPLEKMETTLAWLDLPVEARPQLITLYIPDIDMLGHRQGPDGKHMDDLLQSTDDAIGYLMQGLEARNLNEHIHFVIVSDHGMTRTERSKLIYFDDILSAESMSYLRSREALPLLDLRPKADAPANAVEQIYRELYNYTQSVPNPHFQVYLRQDVPERFHYSASDRITPIVAIPDLGYSFVTHTTLHNTTTTFHAGGNHGYDNLSSDMRAIFLAKGPKIAHKYPPGSIFAPFSSVEVYGFLTELLNMDAAVNNGTLHGQFSLLSSAS